MTVVGICISSFCILPFSCMDFATRWTMATLYPKKFNGFAGPLTWGKELKLGVSRRARTRGRWEILPLRGACLRVMVSLWVAHAVNARKCPKTSFWGISLHFFKQRQCTALNTQKPQKKPYKSTLRVARKVGVGLPPPSCAPAATHPSPESASKSSAAASSAPKSAHSSIEASESAAGGVDDEGEGHE